MPVFREDSNRNGAPAETTPSAGTNGDPAWRGRFQTHFIEKVLAANQATYPLSASPRNLAHLTQRKMKEYNIR